MLSWFGYYLLTELHMDWERLVFVAIDYKYRTKNILCFSFDPVVVVTLVIFAEKMDNY